MADVILESNINSEVYIFCSFTCFLSFCLPLDHLGSVLLFLATIG